MHKIFDWLINVGVDDFQVDLFEGMYKVPNGIAYNSYLIKDEKVAVLDSVDANFGSEWLENIEKSLNGRLPDYMVVLHMEPDHSANIAKFTEKYPMVKIVGNSKTFVLLEEYFGKDYVDNRVLINDGDTLSLGEHTLQFVFAPMVHWPEVMVAYEHKNKVLFSADAFGKFGSYDAKEEWDDEARRYYIGIVGKYGMQVQSLLKKLSGIEVNCICPLHGYVLTENLGYYISLYDKWSSYTAEENGTLIAYTSVYGHTKKAVQLLADMLKEQGETVVVYDLARSDMSLCVSEAFKYSKLVLATTTYNGDIFPNMREFIDCLTERNYQKRTVAFIENGSWAPVAANKMKTKFEKSKNLTFTDTTVKIRSALNNESLSQLKALAEELCKIN
ncbi:MAG: flavodoxin domain-containing protein [Clostridia bacterium]|nr:flavodoxin domain-containing protein [Clostridia bacterium]